MRSIIAVVASLLATAGTAAATYPNPLPCSGTCTDTHDPTLIQRESDDTYWRFSTGGGIDIYSSPDLLGPWTYQGVVLPDGSSISNNGSDDCWAPDVHYVDVDGTYMYILYYAVSTFGTQVSAIGVATSTTLEPGSWTDHGSTGVTSTTGDNYNAIDPNLYVVEEGANYLTFGSFWADIFQVQLTSDALLTEGGTPYEIELNTTSPQPSEGAYVYYYDPWYYLFFSSGQCCDFTTDPAPAGDEYKVMVCRSKHLAEDYVDEDGTSCLESGGTEVLASHDLVYAPGGQGVYDDPTYGTVLYYHYLNTSVSLEDSEVFLGINQIDWSTGWPVLT